MAVEVKVEPNMINPEDFRGTTLRIEQVQSPGRYFVAQVVEPIKRRRDGQEVTILRGLTVERQIWIIPYGIFVEGGEIGGLRFPGILEEAALRYQPQRVVEVSSDHRYNGSRYLVP